jgi:hypothetical protein
VSTDPLGGSGAWHLDRVDGNIPIAGISCASPNLCVAVDDPDLPAHLMHAFTYVASAGVGAWHPATIAAAPGDALGVSCLSSHFCAVGDGDGDMLVSTNPGTHALWDRVKVDTVEYNNTLDSLSCPASTLCVATDEDGDVIVSRDPTRTRPTQ